MIAAKRPIIRQRQSDSSHSKFSQESRLDETNYQNYRKAGALLTLQRIELVKLMFISLYVPIYVAAC